MTTLATSSNFGSPKFPWPYPIDLRKETEDSQGTLPETPTLERVIDYRAKILSGEITFSDIPDQTLADGLSFELTKDAIENQNSDGLQNLILSGANLHITHIFKRPAWHACLTWTKFIGESFDILRIFNENGMQWNHLIFRMIEIAVDRREFNHIHREILRTIVYGFQYNINLGDAKGNTPLHYACSLGANESIISDLISLGADITKANDLKQLPLHRLMLAPPSEDVDEIKILKMLLEDGIKKADINKADKNDLTPLSCAFISLENLPRKPRELRFNQIDHLMECKADWKLPEHPIHYVIRHERFNYFGKFISQFEGINEISSITKETPLIALIKKSDQPDILMITFCVRVLVRKLQEKKVNLNLYYDGLTPFQWAIKMDRTDIADLLITHGSGCMPFLKTEHGDTILHLAALALPETLQYCLKLMKDKKEDLINETDNMGLTALHIFAKVHGIDQMTLLIEEGADTDIKDSRRLTAFDIALEKMDLSACRRLLRNPDAETFVRQIIPKEILDNLRDNHISIEDLKLQELINKSFLNSRLEDVQFFLKGLLLFAKDDAQQAELIQIAGGFFTWGALISRYPIEIQQKRVQRNYGFKTSTTDSDFIGDQIQFGNEMFKVVLTALRGLEKQGWDFYRIYEEFARVNSLIHLARGNPSWRSFKTWRGGKKTGRLLDKFTPMGNYADRLSLRYASFIPKCRQIFQSTLGGKDGAKLIFEKSKTIGYFLQFQENNHRQIQLTRIQFKNGLDEIKTAEETIKRSQKRDYVFYHTLPKHLNDLLDVIVSNHEKLKAEYDENLYKMTAWLLAQANPLARGSNQACLNWMMMFKLHFNRNLCPVRTDIGEANYHMISETKADTLENFESYFEKFSMEVPPDFRHFSNLAEQRAFIEEKLGIQFLGIS